MKKDETKIIPVRLSFKTIEMLDFILDNDNRPSRTNMIDNLIKKEFQKVKK